MSFFFLSIFTISDHYIFRLSSMPPKPKDTYLGQNLSFRLYIIAQKLTKADKHDYFSVFEYLYFEKNYYLCSRNYNHTHSFRHE